jgi:hypothetical protein
MSEERVRPLEQDGVQCLVVLQLLRDDRPLRWLRGELERELYDIDPAAIGVALERLREQSVVCAEDERVWASACARHLDALGFICI